MNATIAGKVGSVRDAAKARNASVITEETRQWAEAVIAGRIAMGLPRVSATVAITDSDIDSMLACV